MPLDSTIDRILIVEDDTAAAEFLTQMLSMAGYNVQATTQSAEFDNAFNMFQPDLLILDVFMPEKDGLEILGSMAEHSWKCAVLLCSGFSTLYTRTALELCHFYEIGEARAITKPFTRDDILTHVRLFEEPVAGMFTVSQLG